MDTAPAQGIALAEASCSRILTQKPAFCFCLLEFANSDVSSPMIYSKSMNSPFRIYKTGARSLHRPLDLKRPVPIKFLGRTNALALLPTIEIPSIDTAGAASTHFELILSDGCVYVIEGVGGCPESTIFFKLKCKVRARACIVQ